MGNYRFISLFIYLLPQPAWASAAPYVKPESLWPFHTFEGLMLLLGFFAAYRAIRSHLPAGDDAVTKKDRKVKAERTSPMADEKADPMPVGPKKMNDQVLNALRVAGLIFMVTGSFLGLHSGGIDYGPAHMDELTTKIFGGALFVVGLSDFLILPKLLGGSERK
jgi:hypothetical protein